LRPMTGIDCLMHEFKVIDRKMVLWENARKKEI
jgi:hypothetical protein